MDSIRRAADLTRIAEGWRAAASVVGLVPTMGSLHEGHEAPIRRASDEADRVVVSIFVNPAQFGPNEDLAGYPSTRRATSSGVAGSRLGPVRGRGLPPGESLPGPDPGPVGETFEGAARPGHFHGVLKVVHRLFDVTGPCRAVFGEKDAQQPFLVRRMSEQAPIRCIINPCPTVRAPTAWRPFRNARLGAEEREQAGCLFLALTEAAGPARSGERRAPVLVAAMTRVSAPRRSRASTTRRSWTTRPSWRSIASPASRRGRSSQPASRPPA